MKKNFICNKNKKQLLLIPLSLAVATVACPFVSFAEQAAIYSDVQNHWAANEIMKWSSNGVLNGYDGKFNPEASITRGEMAVVLNKIMNYQKTEENTFVDVENKFYKDPLLKLYAAGIMVGSDNKMRPNDNITQQEATALLARAFEVEKGSTTMANADNIAGWAKGDVFGMNDIGGLEGINFEAEKMITRAEVVKIIDNIVGNFYSTKGEYIGDTDESVVINTPDVVLKDCTVKGDVIITEGVGDGDATLENVQITGRLIVHGGGTNTVKLEGCTLNTVFVDKPTGDVRVLSENNTKIANTFVNSGATLEGSFEDVSITGNSPINLKADIKNFTADNNAPITMSLGKIETVNLNAEGMQFKMETNASVNTLNVNQKADVETKGQINNVKIEKGAESTKLGGSGQINQVTSNANNVEVNTTNTTVKLGEGVEKITQNGKEVTTSTTKETSDKETNTSQGSSGGGSGSGGGSDDDSSSTKAFKIDKIESTTNGLLKVTLNQKTKTALDKSAFSIICTGGGKDMTILSVTTQDNKVYNLATAYYNDNTYNLEVTLANGKRIDKDFESKFDCAQIGISELKRVEETKAQLTYNSDAPGFFYYLLQPKQETKARAVSLNGEPTAQEVIEQGVKTEMKLHSNTITIENLTKDVGYDMYYVAVDIDKKTTPTRSILIDSKVAEVPEIGEYTIVSATPMVEETNDDYVYVYGFEVVLDKATTEELELSNFKASCPKGPMNLGEVKTTDNKTYKVYMPKGDIPFSNNHYTITITFADGKTAENKFYLDIQPPILAFREFKWEDEDTLTAVVNSDESGSIYYDVFAEDEIDGLGTTKPKDPTIIYESGQKIPMGYGETKVTLKNAEAGKYFCYVAEDEYGNRVVNYDYQKIPVYVPAEPEEPEAVSISNVELRKSSTGKPQLKVTFSRSVNLGTIDTETTISGLSGKLMVERKMQNSTFDDSVMIITIMNFDTLPVGDHELTLIVDEKAVTYTFNVPESETQASVNEETITE